MSINRSVIPSITAAVPAADTPMLTPEQVIEQLRVLRQQIPAFLQLPANEVRQIRQERESRVTVEFAHEAINAVSASDHVQSVVGSTPEELLRAEDELARWTLVESEFRATLRGIAASNLIRRHRLGRAALQAYHISRELARQQEHAQLVPHVESMSRIRRFSRRRARPAVQPEAPGTPPSQSP